MGNQSSAEKLERGYKIFDVGMGLWKGQVLASAIELGLFDFIGTTQKTEKEIAEGMNLKAPRLQDFLNYLVSIGYLTKDKDGKYGNSEDSMTFLVSTSPLCLAQMIKFNYDTYVDSWKNFTSYLKGQEQQTFFEDFGAVYDSRPGTNKMFARVMEHYARFSGELIPIKLESTFKDIKTLADIGGGSGYMSFKICQKFPHLKAINCDLPHLEEVFNEYIARPEFKDVSDKVSFRSLDFQKEEYPADVDALMFGQILHDWRDEIKHLILDKAFKALKSGGRIIIQEYMIDNAKRERANCFLLSLQMQLAASHGNENSREEMAQKLKNAGFVNPTFTELDHIQTVVVAFKP